MPRDVREAVPYILPLGGSVRVGGGVSTPRLTQTNTRIGADLPLPAGEVAMPQALTERGIYPPLRRRDDADILFLIPI